MHLQLPSGKQGTRLQLTLLRQQNRLGISIQGGAEPGASTSWLCDLWQVAESPSASVYSPVN